MMSILHGIKWQKGSVPKDADDTVFVVSEKMTKASNFSFFSIRSYRSG